MPTPKYQTFFLYDSATRLPATGLTIGPSDIRFLTYKYTNGTSVYTGEGFYKPTIIELGGGAYGFLPIFNPGTPDESMAIFYVISCGTGVAPDLVNGYLRPEDFYTDVIEENVLSAISTSDGVVTGAISTSEGNITDAIDLSLDYTKDFVEGKWAIYTTGPNANKMILYKRNDEVLKTFNLLDKDGNATNTSPYQRVPV